MKSRSGGEILADALSINGADTVFCVPGESFLAVLDALHDRTDDIRLITCRHEGGAANMAEAFGKLTGRPGVCMVTRGPGATQASVGVHTAFQDSTPMILLIGQVARNHLGREAFQELDYQQMFGKMAKWVAQVDDTARLPEFIDRAWTTALSGRRGPVVLALPEDMLRETATVGDLPPAEAEEPQAQEDDLRRAMDMLGGAKRPLMIVGGSGWTAEACGHIVAFAEANRLPVASSFRRQDIFDNHHPCWAGDLGIAAAPNLVARVTDADLLLVLGARLGEMTTGGYSRITAPKPAQKLIHIHPGAEELGRVYRTDIAINASVSNFAKAVVKLPAVGDPAWGPWTAAAREDYLAFRAPVDCPGDLDMYEVMAELERRLPADAIIANGAGNYTGWPHRFHQFSRYPSQLAPTSGAMGYGVPAAIAAKVVAPERTVVCFAGDGCFLMTGQELATAAQYGLTPLFLVVNNGMYGTIRMHQEKNYPGRVIATDLHNPDFAAYARSFGLFGETVAQTADFAPALERALGAGTAALIELRIDRQAITTSAKLSELEKH